MARDRSSDQPNRPPAGPLLERRYDVGWLWVGGFIVLLLLALAALIAVTEADRQRAADLWQSAPCEHFRDYPVARLPARCAAHFQTGETR